MVVHTYTAAHILDAHVNTQRHKLTVCTYSLKRFKSLEQRFTFHVHASQVGSQRPSQTLFDPTILSTTVIKQWGLGEALGPPRGQGMTLRGQSMASAVLKVGLIPRREHPKAINQHRLPNNGAFKPNSLPSMPFKAFIRQPAKCVC